MIHFLIIFNIIGVFSFVKSSDAAVQPVKKPIWNETYSDILKRDLLMSYDKFSRPTQHYNTTKVELNLQIKHLDFDEATSIFTVFAWMGMSWNDEKLQWNKTDYANLSTVIMAQHEIWQPDIFLYNSATGNNIDYYGNTHFLVGSSGKVIWVPPSTFKTFCDADLRYWPFDSHKCTLIFGSWVHNGKEVDIEPRENASKHELFIQSGEWEMTELNVGRTLTTYECCLDPYVDVSYNITIKRRSPAYRTVITAPAFVIMLLTLTTFWLPAKYGEKILLNGIVALIVVLFMLYFAQKLNVMASHTPLIVLFYSNTLYLVCFSTLISVIVINLTRYRQQCAVPWILKKNLDGRFGEFLMLHHLNIESEVRPRAEELREQPFDEHGTSEDQQIIQQSRSSKGSFKQDWLKLATAIDRIAFVSYTVIFAISAIVYSV